MENQGKKRVGLCYKLVRYGNYADLLTYTIPELSLKKDDDVSVEKKELSLSEKIELKKKHLRRCARDIKRLIYCNPELTRFATLTYKENMQDYDKAMIDFKNFMKRLNYSLGENAVSLKYISVLEYQKRGAIHFHFLFDRYIPVKLMEKAWGHGFVSLKCVRSVCSCVAYITKYMTKFDTGSAILDRKKAYRTSRNLNRPEELITQCPFEIKEYIDSIKNKEDVSVQCYRTDYVETDFVGQIVIESFVFVDNSNYDFLTDKELKARLKGVQVRE